jgi:hypothetical protein
MLGLATDIRAQSQGQAPDQPIEVDQSTAERLSKMLAGENRSATLNPDAQRLLTGLLPESNRKLCSDLVEAWGPQRSEAVLSARLLHPTTKATRLASYWPTDAASVRARTLTLPLTKGLRAGDERNGNFAYSVMDLTGLRIVAIPRQWNSLRLCR